jgi:hypothetical protein
MKHITVAVSEATFKTLFDRLRDSLHVSHSDSGSFGPFTASYSVGVRLANGTVDLQSNNSVLISELDVVYDPLSLDLGVDIPEVCVGGFCIIPSPFGGCWVRAPRICVFSGSPDISLPLHLGGLINSEISGAFSLDLKHETDPNRTPSMTDLDAEDAGVPDKWKVYLNPIWLDVDLIDIADTAGNILDAAINAAVDGLLGFLPGWARDIIHAILGPIVDLVRFILDIGDDIQEWLSNLLGVSLGLFDFVLTLVADYFAKRNPIYEVEDPYPILPYDGPLIPVKVPLRDMDVTVTDVEMILSTNIGA